MTKEQIELLKYIRDNPSATVHQALNAVKENSGYDINHLKLHLQALYTEGLLGNQSAPLDENHHLRITSKGLQEISKNKLFQREQIREWLNTVIATAALFLSILSLILSVIPHLK